MKAHFLLSVDIIIAFLKNTRKSTEKLLEIINTFNKVIIYKINAEKSVGNLLHFNQASQCRLPREPSLRQKLLFTFPLRMGCSDLDLEMNFTLYCEELIEELGSFPVFVSFQKFLYATDYFRISSTPASLVCV